MHKILLTFLVGLFFAGNSFSQLDPPKLVQPSPSASGLFKFQDYPVDYSTGLAQISIPIYEVTSGSLSVPISISYHGAGRKVYDQDGPIALGWSLSAGGMISRVIHGMPDFGSYIFPNPFNTTSLTNYNNLAYLQRIMRYQNSSCGTLFPFYDAEYDVFSYSVGGNNGKFIFKDVANVKTPVLLPYKPLVVTPINPSPNVITFDITDDKGVVYKFGGYEYTQLDEYATTGWVLEKIISADKTDTISFVYTGGVETRKTISQMIIYKDNWEYGQNLFPVPPNPLFTQTTSQANYQVSRISEIIFRQGKVKFNLVSGTLRMDNIQVLNLNNEVIKTVKFNTSSAYFQAEINNVTNNLTAVEFKDKLNTVTEKYSFEYYPIVNSDVNGPINVRYCDWWGYYNNSGQHDMIPQFTVSAIGYQTSQLIGNPNGNRQPSLEPTKSGVLKKITYPTGGSTEFVYQLNKCVIMGGNGSVVDGPGLRIYQIKSTDGNGTTNMRTFRYGYSESGYGSLELVPDPAAITNQTMFYYFDNVSSNYSPPPDGSGYHRERYFTSGFYEEISELAERPVTYEEVTEYKGNEATNTGKTVYKYDYAPWGAAALFPKKHISSYNYWSNPSLIAQTDYKRNRTVYQKIKSSRSYYNANITENVKGLHIQRRYSLPQDGIGWGYHPGTSTFQNLCSEQYAAYERGMPVYSFSDYQVVAGFKNLTQTIDTLFTDAGNLITTTFYTYNSKNLLSNTSTTSSKAETVLSDIKYPFDYTGNTTLTQMVSLNMLNYPVEQIETKAATPTKSVRTNYFNWGTSPARIAPQTVELKIGSGAYETRLRYSAYDTDGNPLTVSKENDQLISYVWGYNNTYPIAEVTNTAVKNVFHTSFEDAEGNSTLNDSKTGQRSRTGGYSKPLTNLDNVNYILSYWQKSGAVWVLQSSTVSVTTGSYTISLTGQLDEVRFYPKGSEMKTYTYDPLIGIITECDISDHIIYYEYDNYNRLKLMKDMNGNILKTFKYQYQGTTPN